MIIGDVIPQLVHLFLGILFILILFGFVSYILGIFAALTVNKVRDFATTDARLLITGWCILSLILLFIDMVDYIWSVPI